MLCVLNELPLCMGIKNSQICYYSVLIDVWCNLNYGNNPNVFIYGSCKSVDVIELAIVYNNV